VKGKGQKMCTVEDCKPGWAGGWGSYLGARERPPLEMPAGPPLDVLEWGGGWARATGAQEGAMI
jgi:hypothetical protein